MQLGLEGKAVKVTDGSRGIGRAIAEPMSRADANVSCGARNEAQLRRTLTGIEGFDDTIHSSVCDVASADELIVAIHEANVALTYSSEMQVPSGAITMKMGQTIAVDGGQIL